MTEPRRLKDDDGIGALLIQSAADDGPSASSRRAIAGALGIAVIPVAVAKGTAAAATSATGSTTVVGGAAPATAIAAKAGIPIVAKLIVGVTLATGLGVGIAVKQSASSSAPTQPPPIATSRSATHAAPPDRVAIAPPEVVADPVADPVPIAAPVVPVPRPPADRRPRPPRPPAIGSPATSQAASNQAASSQAASTDSPTPAAGATAPTTTPEPAQTRPSLADEVAVLDAALVALRGHDAAAALRALDQYDRQFPEGALASEAAVARIEATFATGDRSRGRALAAKFLASHGDSPLSHRVRTLSDR